MKNKIIGIFICMLFVATANSSMVYITECSTINNGGNVNLGYISELCINGWTIEKVDINGSVGFWNSITLDELDNVHILYYADNGPRGLRYANNIGEEWNKVIIDDEGEPGFQNSLKAIDIDSNGYPHAVYVKGAGDGSRYLEYVKQTNEGWVTITLAKKEPNGDYPIWYPSVALDSNDTPHIVYQYINYPFNGSYGGIKYITYNGTDWVSEIVDSSYENNYVNEPKIVLDSNQYPCICYTKNNFIYYAKRNDSGWVKEQVCATGTGWSDIALDSNDFPHITHNNKYGNLMYTKLTSEGWNSSELDYYITCQTAIALDSNDYPHISYSTFFTEGKSALKYVMWNGSKWIYTLVDYGEKRETGRYSSIAIDFQDKPHISYYDGRETKSTGILKYAYSDNSPPINTPPNIPVITGPTNGSKEKFYNFTFTSIDPDNNYVYYCVDWGYGKTEYTTRYHSGENLTLSHSWRTEGTYIIKIKAIDDFNNESEWGTLEVIIPRTRSSMSSLFLNLAERFPILGKLLKI